MEGVCWWWVIQWAGMVRKSKSKAKKNKLKTKNDEKVLLYKREIET